MKIIALSKWQIVLSVFVAIIMIVLVIKPQAYMTSCLNGILMWSNSVLPALFPFFFFSSLLIKLGSLDKLGNLLSGFMEKLFHCPGNSGIIYILSIISGYPVGAKITSEMYKNGLITHNQVVRINAFTSTSGPLFIVGAVGVGMFVNHHAGIIMLLSHIVGALLNGFLYRNYHYIKKEQNVSCANIKTEEIISKTMYDSILSILLVGGYIIVFNILIDMMYNTGVLELLSSLLSMLLDFCHINNNIADGIVSGIFEITRGCLDLKDCTNIKTITILGCMIVSWGGFSIHMQALTFLSECKISIPFYLLQKITHSLFSGLIALVLVNIFM